MLHVDIKKTCFFKYSFYLDIQVTHTYRKVLSFSDPDPILSPMGISWLVSGLTFVVALIIIVIVAKVLCNKERKPSELERETRTCEFLFHLQQRFE